MEIQFKPSVLKLVTLPFTILVLALYLIAEANFYIKYGSSFAGHLEKTGKLETGLWKLGNLWLSQVIFVPVVFFSRYTISDDSIAGYSGWFKAGTIKFSDVKYVKVGFLGLIIKVVDRKDFCIRIFSLSISKPQHSWVREKLGLDGRT